MKNLEKTRVQKYLDQRILLIDNEKELNAARSIIENEGGRVQHQFGRLLIVKLNNNEAAILKKLPRKAKLQNAEDVDEKLLSKTEALALEAFKKRSAPGFKALRSRKIEDDSLWQGDESDHEDEQEHEHEHETPKLSTKNQVAKAQVAEVLPAPERLINKNAMAIVLVDGVAPERKFSFAEKVNVILELQEAMEWMEDFRPSANISWVYDIYEPTVDAVPWEGAPYKNMPDAWYDGWDASCTNSHNGKIYAFKGNEYIRFSNLNNGMDASYPRPIAGNWKGLPPHFESNLDAALWREQNQRIYLFKGSEYARINPANFTMDAGYPKPIAGHWKNLPSEFESGIDLAIGHKNNNAVYLFKGSEYVRFSNGSTTMDPAYPRPIAGNWKDLPESFTENGMHAGFWRDSNQRIYLFRNSRWGAKFSRINSNNFTADASINGLYTGLSKGDAEALWMNPALEQLGMEGSHDGGEQLAANLKASTNSDHAITVYITKHAVVHFAYAGGYRWTYSQSNFSGNLSHIMLHETMHLFGAPDEYLSTSSCTSDHGRFLKAKNGNSKACAPAGDNCIMRNNSMSICPFTKKHLGWGAFESKIDAIVYRGNNDKTYAFSNDQYIRYTDIANGRDANYPTLMGNISNVGAGFKGLPKTFRQNIDAALWREDNGALYFFRGSQYVRFSNGSVFMDAGYPKPIAGHWKGLPASFQSNIDAAFWRESNSKMYLFKGNKYVRLSVVGKSPTMDAGYPKLISAAWKGLPYSFEQGIDAALMRRDTGQMYLFKGGRYVRYSNNAGAGIDAGYPAWIDKNWMPFPRKTGVIGFEL